MHFHSWADFWAMGGYAGFVWGSYAVTALLLGGVVVGPILRRRALLRELRAQVRRRQRAQTGGEVGHAS